MVRLFWIVGICLLCAKAFYVGKAEAATYDPCWSETSLSTHPLFHRDRESAKTPPRTDTLRIAFLLGADRDVEAYAEYLQGALDNSGVDVEVEVACVGYVDDVPRGTLDAYYYVRDNYTQDIARRNAADMVSYLGPYAADGYCGVASVGNGSPWVRTNVTTCDRLSTYAHEVGHNFGLHHAHQSGYNGRKGYCYSPSPSARDCSSGTLMSYAGSNRDQRFADYEAGYGTEENTAVQWLRKVMPAMVRGYEDSIASDASVLKGYERPLLCPEASHREKEWPSPLARLRLGTPTN